jgi:hypothetical protein
MLFNLLHKENAIGYDIKGYTIDVDLAELASGRISICLYVLLICHDFDFLPDINKFINSVGARWVAGLARVGERNASIGFV